MTAFGLSLLPMICSELAFAQTSPRSAIPSASQKVSPDCAASDLDTTYQFTNQLTTERVIVTFRNISGHSCIFHPGDGVTFGGNGHNIWTKECRNCEPDGTPKIVGQLEVATGASAQLFVTWKTQADVGGEACQEGGTLNGNAWSIWSVSLLGNVCSVVLVDSYLPEAVDEQKQNLRSQTVPNERLVTITLTASGETVYSLDSFWLHLTLEDRKGELELKENSCPLLFVRTRGSDGSTSLQEESGFCHLTPLGQQPGRSIRLDLATLGWGALGTPVDHSVQVFALLGSPDAQQVEMVTSNTLNLRTLDPATIPRTWGPESKGLAISLFLDKGTYLLGENIPLRMAVKNVSADATIASGELPCFAGITFEVRDPNGRDVAHADTMPCTGHGWLMTYLKGKVFPVTGLTLQAFGLLPEQPGKYTVVATWNAMSDKANRPGSASGYYSEFGATLTPYAIVHSQPVAFEVVSQPQLVPAP